MLFSIVITIKASVKGGNIIFFKRSLAFACWLRLGRAAARDDKILRSQGAARIRRIKYFLKKILKEKIIYETINKKNTRWPLSHAPKPTKKRKKEKKINQNILYPKMTYSDSQWEFLTRLLPPYLVFASLQTYGAVAEGRALNPHWFVVLPA